MILDEAPMRALSRRFGLAARLPAQHRSAGGRFGYGADAGRDDSLDGLWELASMSSPSGFRLNMDCA